MKKIYTIIATLILLQYSAFAYFSEIVTKTKSPIQTQAVLDARAQIAKVEGKIPEIKTPESWSNKDAIIVGVASENPLLKKYEAKAKSLKYDGFLIDKTNINGANTVVVCAANDLGVANGIYELLRQLGFGFSLGSEFIPSSLDVKNVIAKEYNPELKVRGFLPWHNFYNSPTVWDYVDFRAFIDDAVRLGANFIGFHNYEGEPIIAHYDANGRLIAGGRLFSTKSPNWGTHTTKAKDFGFGTNNVYSQEYFGAKTTEIIDDKEALFAEQKIIADALAYAKSRGIKTAIGFDPTFYAGTPIPTSENMLQKFIVRLKFLLERYPSVDYIWIWPCEASAVSGILAPSGTQSETNALANYARDAMKDFEEIATFDKTNHPWLKKTPQGALERVQTGVAYEHLAQAALRVFSEFNNPPKLIIAGWGGDENLLTEVYFSGWCKRLPKDKVSYAALEHFFPKPRTSASYHTLPKDCERWPIPWLENDGDQWQPRPFVKTYEGFMTDLFKSGSQGVLGIHWRTRCVGENFQYLCDRAWNKNLSREQFYTNYARRLYGNENLSETSSIHNQLDMLPDRWLGGSGQGEAANFSWGTLGSEEDLQKLLLLRKQAENFKFKNAYAQANWDWLKTRIDWALNYKDMTKAALLAQELIKQNNFKEALNALSDKSFARAFQTYVKRLSTRGEYGVLATANAKAYYDWKKMFTLCLEKLETQTPLPNHDWNVEKSESKIILPRHFTSLEKGQNLEVEPIVLGNKNAWIFYRKIGEKIWQKTKLENEKNWVFKAVIDSQNLGDVGVEFKFGFSENPNDKLCTKIYTAVIMPNLPEYKRKQIADTNSVTKNFNAKIFKHANFPIALKWDKVDGVEYYRVIRDGILQCTTGVEYFYDASNKAKGEYVVEGIKDAQVVSKSNPVAYTMPNIKVNEIPNAKFVKSNKGVLIKIDAPKDVNATNCIIYRSGKLLKAQTLGSNVFQHIDQKQKNEKGETVVAELETSTNNALAFFDEVAEGDWSYRIVFANQFRNEAKDSFKEKISLRKKNLKDAVNFSLSSMPENSKIVGDAKFSNKGFDSSKGYMLLESQDIKNLEGGYTLSFTFTPIELKDSAVIISNGAFPNKGWYLQCSNGNLSLMGDMQAGLGLPCGKIEVGKSYKFELIYDGANITVKVNDKVVQNVRAKKAITSPTDCKFAIGNYSAAQENFHFKGIFKNLKITLGVN